MLEEETFLSQLLDEGGNLNKGVLQDKKEYQTEKTSNGI